MNDVDEVMSLINKLSGPRQMTVEQAIEFMNEIIEQCEIVREALNADLDKK